MLSTILKIISTIVLGLIFAIVLLLLWVVMTDEGQGEKRRKRGMIALVITAVLLTVPLITLWSV